MINNILNKAKNLIYKDGKTVEQALDDRVTKKSIYSFYPTNLPFDSYNIGDGQSLEMVCSTAKVYLLTIYNSYNVGCVYIIQAGTNRGPVAITQIAGNTSNFTVTAVSLNSFSVKATNAAGRISVMCIGGHDQ